jgi:CDP-paratose 2-epimerase
MSARSYTLVTGGAGFIGSNLADALLADGEPVVVLDNLSRPGVERNARWLRERHPRLLRVERGDVRDRGRVAPLVAGARRVVHLAAQVAVTTSVEDPALDLETNLLGTFHVLEAARSRTDPPPVLFASTNKVYGSLPSAPAQRENGSWRYADGRAGIDETAPLDFHSPYGCSKGAADQYVHDYGRIYGLPTVVFRLSCVYGPRQFGTEDQGWVAHFARRVVAGRPVTIYGDGCQVRDVLYVADLVRAVRTALDRIDATAGRVFNLGGGAANAVSVRAVLDRLMELAGRCVPVEHGPWRPGDQMIYVSDAGRARRTFGWAPVVGWERGLERLLVWLREAEAEGRRAVPRAFDPRVAPLPVPARAAS